METIETVGITSVTLAAFALVKWVIDKRSGNGKAAPLAAPAPPIDYQALLNSQVMKAMGLKVDEKVCEVTHKNVDEKFDVLFTKVDNMTEKVTEIHSATVNKSGD